MLGYEARPFEILGGVEFSLTRFLLAVFKNLKPSYLERM